MKEGGGSKLNYEDEQMKDAVCSFQKKSEGVGGVAVAIGMIMVVVVVVEKRVGGAKDYEDGGGRRGRLVTWSAMRRGCWREAQEACDVVTMGVMLSLSRSLCLADHC